MNREVKLILRKIAKEHNISFQDIEKVYEAPFKLQAFNMKNNCDRSILKFPSLRIPYFGIFHCPEWHKRRLKKHNETIRTN